MPINPSTTWTNAGLMPIVNPLDAVMIDVALKASTTYQAGAVLGELTATLGTYAPYLSTNSDGSQNAKVILKYACVTDASGNIGYGPSTSGGEWGETTTAAPVYISGTFQISDMQLTGGAGALDAAGATSLGRIVEGSVAGAAGILRVG